MTEKAEFIKIPPSPSRQPQTMPTAPEQRIASSEISISLCEEKDVDRIVEGLYTCWPEASWAKREPPSLRPDPSTRHRRLVARLRPTFSIPHMHWIKAVYKPTGEIIGIAGWMGPGIAPVIHSVFRRSAFDFYGWKEKYNFTDKDIDDMFQHVDMAVWEADIERADGARRDLLAEEPHWYLATLFTWPEYQGKGVGKLLLKWAIEKADATTPVTPLCLESAPHARAVYMHMGFVPRGPHTFIRRGPAVVRGLEAEEGKIGEKADVNVVAKEAEAGLA